MKHHSIKIITVMLGAAMSFAACGNKEEIYSTTHPIVGKWQYQSATAEIIHFGTGDTDTVFDLGDSAPWKNIVFLPDYTAVIEVQSEDTVVPPSYVIKTFKWYPGFETAWSKVVELYSEGGFYAGIYIEENSNGILKFRTSGPADFDAHNQVCYHYTYSCRPNKSPTHSTY